MVAALIVTDEESHVTQEGNVTVDARQRDRGGLGKIPGPEGVSLSRERHEKGEDASGVLAPLRTSLAVEHLDTRTRGYFTHLMR